MSPTPIPRAPRPAFANHDTNHGASQTRHFEDRVGDHLGLATLLGADAWVGAGVSIRRDDGKSEFGREFHFCNRLAIPLGMGATIVAGDAFLQVFSFLMANEHDLVFAQLGHASANRPIVAERPVAVQFDKIVEHKLDVVGGHRPLGMPRDLNDLPGLELVVDLSHQVDAFAPQTANFVARRCTVGGGALELGKPPLQLVDGLLER